MAEKCVLRRSSSARQTTPRRFFVKGVVSGLIVGGLGGNVPPVMAQVATPSASPISCAATTERENEALVRRYIAEVWNGHDITALSSLLTDDVVHHRGLGAAVAGIAAHQTRVEDFVTAFPDLRLTVDEVITARDRVVARATWSGTQRGKLFGLPPTNRSFAATALLEFRIACGRIAEMWFEVDNLSMYEQLGVITPDELASVAPATAATPAP